VPGDAIKKRQDDRRGRGHRDEMRALPFGLADPGFLGSRADLLLDLVVTGFVVYVPVFLYSMWSIRHGKLQRHRRLQTALLVTLGVVVLLFETSVRFKGGARALFAGSRYAGTALLSDSFHLHLSFAAATFLGWAALLYASWRRHRSSLPGAFGRLHRRLGLAVLASLIMTVATSIELYVVGMVL
jgi:hypothetical protein